MGLSKKLKYVLDHPGAVVDYFRLERQLSENRRRGVSNILFQCDAKGHFPYLKPYYEELQGAENVATYFTGSDLSGEVLPFLLQNGIPPERIITYNSLVRLTDWDVYISPTSWGNVFPRNPGCRKIQLSVALAEKNVQLGENLIQFDTFFVSGPIHHEILKRHLFEPFPEAKTKCTTYDIGFAKIDALLNGGYDNAAIRKNLKIEPDDPRKILLYAPNWEATSALYKYKDRVFEVLKKTDYITLIKLHYISMLSATKPDSAGDVDWKKLLWKYEHEENMRIIRDASIDPYMSVSDLMVTDYGGASLEFMCTGKPVVYLDCPEFFEQRGTDILEYRSRESGTLVSDIEKLPEAIETALKGDPAKERMRNEMVDRLLYNRGAAAKAGTRVILGQLLARKS